MTLTEKMIHAIRTEAKTDAYWSRKLRVTTRTIRNARTGITWPRHPTPPDRTPRIGDGRKASSEAVHADPLHFRLLDEEGLNPWDYVDPRVPPSAVLSLPALRKLKRSIICCGIYFLWRRQELLYVGQSRLVANRLSQHEQAGMIPFSHHTCLPCNYEQLNTLEFDYIETYKPPYNKAIHRPGAPKSFPSSINTLHSEALCK